MERSGTSKSCLIAACSPTGKRRHLKVLEKEIAGQLKVYKDSMKPEDYKQTFDLMLLKRLREEAGIPRLGLFYL